MLNQLSSSQMVPDLNRSGGLAGALADQAAIRPDAVAIRFEGGSTTYAELYRKTLAVAAQLDSLGIKPQDRVGILFPNHPDFIACFFAVVGLGAIVVPINPLLRSEEISHILSDSGANALIVHVHSLSEALMALPALDGLKHLIISPGLPPGVNETTMSATVATCNLDTGNVRQGEDHSDGTVPDGHFGGGSSRSAKAGASEAGSARGSLRFAQGIDSSRDLALIIYTSGTTGRPKGAMLTHANLMAVVPDALLGQFDVDHNDRCLGMLPLCHIYGLGVIVFANIARGACVIILPKFEAAEVLEVIESERVTLLPAVPSMYQFLLLELEKTSRDLSSVRWCFSGAAPLSVDLANKVEKVFAAPVIEGYALSETACGATINPRDKRKIGSIGKTLPGIAMAVMDDDGRFLPAGPENVGEIAIKGPQVMRGYHNHPEATAEVMRDGWFLTGDLGWQDVEGYFYIVGRKKEMIIRGGQNIYPREIEDVIMRMPGVREVAVIGVPDEFMGERVKAIVVLRDGSAAVSADEVKEHCARQLAPYKVPRLVEFRGDLLPRNSTGKVLKRLLS